jgi:Tol biopolymer transport system component
MHSSAPRKVLVVVAPWIAACVLGALEASAQGRRVNAPLVSGGNVTDFALAKGGVRVVYRADLERNDVFELYGVPIDGSASPVKLSPSPVHGGDVVEEFWISPDGRRVVYLADAEVDGFSSLYSSPLDGSAPTVKLSGALAVPLSVFPLRHPRISADSARVVFETDVFELYSAPIDGSSPAVPLHGTAVSFRLDSLGQRVVFNSGAGLYSVPIDGSSSPVQLTALALNNNGNFDLSPDGTRAVYQAANGFFNQLYSVLIDGSAAPSPIGGPEFPNRYFWSWTISDDSATVVYLVNQFGRSEFAVFSVPIDGSAPPLFLTAALEPGRTPYLPILISRAESRAVFPGGTNAGVTVTLYSVPLDGSLDPVQLVPDGPFGIQSTQLVAGGREVLYLAGGQCLDLAVDGSSDVRRIDRRFPENDVTSYRTAGDLVVYLTDPATGAGPAELFASFRTRPHRSR